MPNRRVADVIDEIGLGRAQALAVLLGGAVYLSEGCALYVLSLCSSAVAAEVRTRMNTRMNNIE